MVTLCPSLGKPHDLAASRRVVGWAFHATPAHVNGIGCHELCWLPTTPQSLLGSPSSNMSERGRQHVQQQRRYAARRARTFRHPPPPPPGDRGEEVGSLPSASVKSWSRSDASVDAGRWCTCGVRGDDARGIGGAGPRRCDASTTTFKGSSWRRANAVVVAASSSASIRALSSAFAAIRRRGACLGHGSSLVVLESSQGGKAVCVRGSSEWCAEKRNEGTEGGGGRPFSDRLRARATTTRGQMSMCSSCCVTSPQPARRVLFLGFLPPGPKQTRSGVNS